VTRATWYIRLSFLTGAALIAAALAMMIATSGAQAAPRAHAANVPAPRAGAGHTPSARNGDNGTVKIHRADTPTDVRANQPHVCQFYLDGFGFDPAQSVTWHITAWAPTGDRKTVVLTGALPLDTSGNGATDLLSLPDGHYKLFWNFTGEKGRAKHKVFWVKCAPATTPPPTSPPPSPTCGPESCPPTTPTTPPSCAPASCPPTTTPPSSPTPSTSVAATSASSPAPPGGGGLPTTGEPLALIGGTGLGLLATGGVATMLARRRRGYGR
jgi:hypothetical protein